MKYFYYICSVNKIIILIICNVTNKNNMELAVTEKILYNIVQGSLKTCIDAHGPITKQFIPSASKRVKNQIKAPLIEDLKKEIQLELDDNFVIVEKEYLEKMKKSASNHSKTVNHFLTKIEELNKQIEKMKK